MSEFDKQIETTKTIPFDKKHIIVEKDTFDTMHKAINESKKVMELQPKINEVFNEINNYADSYNSLEKDNQKYQREIKSLKTRNTNLLQENNKLKSHIDTILEVIKKFFRKLLQIGNEPTKETTTTEIKDYYDNEDFNSNDVYEIAENTSKEDELFDYADIPSYLKINNKNSKNKNDDFELNIKILLKVSKLSKSTYYYNISKNDKDDKNTEIIEKIKEIFYYHKQRYGYRRITLELRNQGYNVNHKKVYRLMVKLNLKPLKRNKRKYSSYKGTIGKIADNYIERKFESDKPNKKWYTDVTEFNLRGNKIYLSPILDGFNGEVISYNISKSANLEQIKDMFDKAFNNRNLEGLIFHSDQGWQYQHNSYQSRLKEKGIKQITKAIEDYINYYNFDRIKVKLKGLSPVNYRLQSLNQ